MLSRDEIKRYGRQMIVQDIGRPGQESLAGAAVLIVGCGGLGCPAALYLAGAGVGTLGLLDYDSVELHNLHRQILHNEGSVKQPKCESAAAAIARLNSRVRCVIHHVQICHLNAMEIINPYDVVIDASDNVATRYLLNDACVMLSKPLVSGSALQWEGQLTVYNHEGGPCYRCLYPQPPPPAAVSKCSESGVIGPVTGAIGAMQALEAIKIICRCGSVMSGRLLLFDGLAASNVCVKLRPRQPDCSVCGEQPSVTRLIDYEQFCGSPAADGPASLSLLNEDERLTATAYHELLSAERTSAAEVGQPGHLLLDTRPPAEFGICHLPHAVNIPLAAMASDEHLGDIRSRIRAAAATCVAPTPPQVVVVCKLGNDSQLAVQLLKAKLGDTGATFRDLQGGLMAWAAQVDRSFPEY